jgi:hypothetical protein
MNQDKTKYNDDLDWNNAIINIILKSLMAFSDE